MFERFQNLRQRIRTIEEYTKEFYELVSRNDLSNNEEQLVSRYLGGLRQSIQDVLCVYTFWTVSDVYQRALAIEKQQTRSGNHTRGSQNKFTRPKQAEHGAKSHMSLDCRKERGKQLLIENEKREGDDFENKEEYTVEPSYDEYDENNEDNFLYGDTGQMLVIKKSLLLPKEESGDWHRNNIFHTTYTIQDKVCKLIINSGSCENVISQDAIEKLKLKQEKHPKPYKQILMDAYHILLGRPWQFDRCTTHDGRSNTYTFNKDNLKVTLVPSKELGHTKLSKRNNENLLSISKFMGNVDESGMIFALVVRKAETPFSAYDLVKSLLEKFADVMPTELPSGLPLMRDIQHQIDLVPGSSLPNKPVHRINPREHEELQRQVEEAIEKGLIRISMSPCAVPALLTHKKDCSWRICVDSRAINKITVKYRYLIPRLDDMLDQHAGSKVYSEIDLRSGYHQIRIQPEDEWKTAFKTRKGVYEWLVMPFGLSNAPTKGVMVDRSNVQAIVEWPTPHSIHDVQNFGKVFEEDCDASKVRIGAVLSQEGHPNKVVDVLSRRASCLSVMRAEVQGFDTFKEMYLEDAYFRPDLVLPHAEFAYNNSKNRTTQRCPFEVVYGHSPDSITDLTPIPISKNNSVKADEFAKQIRKTHEQVKLQIEINNSKYKAATDVHRRRVLSKEGDYMWAILTKDRLPLKKINDNAYKLQLPSHLNTLDVFNVKYLVLFKGDLKSNYNLRASSSSTG
ncbi:putative CCCH-type zinc finger family protein, partial [Tanacetum coccineum]